MKRIIALIVLLLFGFYVVWPGWSAYQIATALETGDQATLARKIAFNDVRASLKPTAEAQIGAIFDRLQSQADGTAAAIAGGLKQQLVPQLANAALAALVTPEVLIRLAKDRRSLDESVNQLLKQYVEKVGGPGRAAGDTDADGELRLPGGIRLPRELRELAGSFGIGTPDPPDRAASSANGPEPDQQDSNRAGEQPSFGINNIKSFSFLGPLGLAFGIAKDQAATKPDAIIEMRFVDFDWRVTAVRPQL